MCTYPLSISIPIGRFIKAERERTCESSERPSERPKWIRTADCSSLRRVSRTSHQYLIALHTITATSSSVPTGFTHQSINQ